MANAEVGSAYVSVFPKMEGFGKKIYSGISSGLKVAAGAAVAGATAVTAAIGGIATASLKSYAQYEQLLGGVNTLFGETDKSLEDYAASVGKTASQVNSEWLKMTEGSRLVKENAEKAFQTAGMSTNKYMETVTSFGAALKKSLGGDTVAAAKMADMAVKDMADKKIVRLKRIEPCQGCELLLAC